MTAPVKGQRGFELDLHVAFVEPLPEAEALAALRVFPNLRAELYRPHPQAISREASAEADPAALIPSARLTGPLEDAEAVRSGFSALLGAQARFIEGGVRGFLRSSEGATEWMPWRRTRVLPRRETVAVAFEEGVRYVLE